MRRLTFFFLAFAAAGAVAVTAAASKRGTPTISVRVLGAPAGDHLQVRLKGGKLARVRILGVRAPSLSSCYGRQAAAATRELAAGQQVKLRGNLAKGAYVTLANGQDLGALLVERGAAQIDVWGPRVEPLQTYVPIQREAELTRQGMWNACTADLEVSITGPASGAPGQFLVYNAVIKNGGPLVARRIDVEMRPGNYSEQLRSVDVTGGTCAPATWRGICTIENLAPGATTAVRMVIVATRRGALSARVEASLTGCAAAQCGAVPLLDPNPESNHAAAVTVLPGAEYEPKCDDAYVGVCIPIPPPDLDCEDFLPLRKFPVKHDVRDGDDHHLDGNRDGIGCDEEDY